MGRVLPSGRVFGEAVDLPNVQFAQREKFGGRLQEVIESPVTDLAVAGISRIADELDYRDRLNAEKQRQAAAQSAVTQAQQQLQQLQTQQTAAQQPQPPAPAAPPLPPLKVPDLTGVTSEGDAFWRAAEANVGPERTAEMLQQMKDMDDSTVAGMAKAYAEMAAGARPIPAGGALVRDAAGATLAAAAFAEESERRRQLGSAAVLDEFSEEVDQFKALGREMMAAATPVRGLSTGEVEKRLADLMALEGLPGLREDQAQQVVAKMEELSSELQRRYNAGEPALRERDVEPGLMRISPAEPGVSPRVVGMAPPAEIEFEERVEEVVEPKKPVQKRDFAKEIADAEAKLEKARASVGPARFVPRTLADYRFQIRELGRELVSTENPQERAAIIEELRSTMQGARRAVDVHPDGLIEAVTGVAGRGAQKIALEDMTAAEKEFLKQMYDASKEKRAAELHTEKLSVWKEKGDKARKRMEARAKGGTGRSRADMQEQLNWVKDYNPYSTKSGYYSDEAVAARHGSVLDDAGIEQKRREDYRQRTGKYATDTPASFPLKAGTRDAKDAAKAVAAARMPSWKAVLKRQEREQALKDKKDLEDYKNEIRQGRVLSPSDKTKLFNMITSATRAKAELYDEKDIKLLDETIRDAKNLLTAPRVKSVKRKE